MTGSKRQLDGRIRCADVDWNNVDRDDLDAGEYTNQCPDNNRKLFEFGARCIADSARSGDVHKMLVQLSPYKIKRELTQLDNKLRKLSFATRNILGHKDDKPFDSPLDRLQHRVNDALENVRKGRGKRDISRSELGENAWAIWAAHGGDVKADVFFEFVQRLVDNAGRGDETADVENSDDDKKTKISAYTLTHEIRMAAKERKPLPWELF